MLRSVCLCAALFTQFLRGPPSLSRAPWKKNLAESVARFFFSVNIIIQMIFLDKKNRLLNLKIEFYLAIEEILIRVNTIQPTG